MKGLFHYLSPFAPDCSGAVSVLYELGGIIVVCDAGGCTGNICGFDEPRWLTKKSAVFSAGIRDLDAIMGRDDRLIDKIADAVSTLDCNFIALVGTPVPAVIGTDFKGLARLAKKRFGLPVLTVDSTEIDLYDRGQQKAYLSLFETFAEENPDAEPFLGVIGATPLDLADNNSGERIISRLEKTGFEKVVLYGMGSGLCEIKNAGAAICNLVLSPSGLSAAQYLKKRFGTPYVAGVPLSVSGAEKIKSKIEAASQSREKPAVQQAESEDSGGVLIIHQQFMANTLRDALRAQNYEGRIDIASYFMMDTTYAHKTDAALREEKDLSELIGRRRYGIVAGDPLFVRAIGDFGGEYIGLPHYAVSGGIYEENAFASGEKKLFKICRGGKAHA